MPQKPLIVLDNLDDFSGKLLSQIAEDTIASRQQLTACISQAAERYNKPSQIPILGWIYGYNRRRGAHIAKALTTLENLPDPLTRLNEFRTLINEGHCISGSFNYYLLLALIQKVRGYQPVAKNAETVVVNRLKELLTNKMDSYIADFKANLRMIKERDRERIECPPVKKTIQNVKLFNQLPSAQLAAQDNQDRACFYVAIANNQWQLQWVDPTGASRVLDINEELTQLLIRYNITDVERVSPIVLKQLMHECLKIRADFLSRITLLRLF
jgi:hypothetical protein